MHVHVEKAGAHEARRDVEDGDLAGSGEIDADRRDEAVAHEYVGAIETPAVGIAESPAAEEKRPRTDSKHLLHHRPFYAGTSSTTRRISSTRRPLRR
jgi:hypothetical protein